MTRLYRPSEVRAASYAKVQRIFVRPTKQPGAKPSFVGSGFFTTKSPNVLLTAAHVEVELLTRGVVDLNPYVESEKEAGLVGFCETEDQFLTVGLQHGQIIELPSPFSIDIAALPVAMSGRVKEAKANRALEINADQIDFGAKYFIPVMRRGRLCEFSGNVVQEGSRSYVFKATTWPGYSGSPLFDEDGKAVGLIFQGVETVGGLGDEFPAPILTLDIKETGFTPFSLLASLGMLDVLLPAGLITF